jgi:hypothetical protein
MPEWRFLSYLFMIKITHTSTALLTGVALLALHSNTQALEFSGYIAAQGRAFFDDPLDPRQHNNYTSFSTEPELYHSWDNDNQSITITPYYLHDQYDDKRTHADVREFSWQRVYDDWELTVGISKVYWGVTETSHLVDIVNQTDQVVNVDGEDKLGQTMIHASTDQDWGVLDFFILPGFRDRTFAGVEGRPRQQLPTGLRLDTDTSTYESSDGSHHIDYAVRWFTFADEWELGLSYFTGTGREPESFNVSSTGVIVPHYSQINQTGLDLQVLIEEWTWKLEMISRDSSIERFFASTAGFEYTFVGLGDGQTDLGIVIEYLYDERDELATSPFQNDLTTAFRIALNDAASSEILFGFITDIDDKDVSSFIEASRRIGDSFKIEVEARTFNSSNPNRPLYGFRQDDFVQAELAWYF